MHGHNIVDTGKRSAAHSRKKKTRAGVSRAQFHTRIEDSRMSRSISTPILREAEYEALLPGGLNVSSDLIDIGSHNK
jgi:hypothetical protein